MTNLSFRVLPRFPARVLASNGLTTEVQNGVDVVVVPDYGSLIPVPSVTNPTATYFMAWDSSIDYYQSISFQNFADNLADQVLVGSLLALSNLTMAANKGIYFDSTTTAATFDLSSYMRGLLASADVTAFKTSLSLNNVDNTSDANKPVSTPQQTALNLKANLASPTFTGTPAGPTATANTNTTQFATTAFVLGQAATQALQEAASSNVVFVTPGRQAFHPSAAKGFACVTQSAGTYTLQAGSNNVASITKNGTGDVTVTWSTSFSSAFYAPVATAIEGGTFVLSFQTVAAGSVRVLIRNGTTGTSTDIGFAVVAFGDL
jgi:hypothetical protein